MEDLGEAMASGQGIKMLGGGQPAAIPEMESLWRSRMEEILRQDRALERMLGVYDPPRGNAAFLLALAGLLREEFGWEIGVENLAVTAGGQTAFFFLFNALAEEGRKILLPLCPEYIGYASQGIAGDIFRAVAPRIELIGEDQFKYRVNFDELEIGDDVAAVCVSRPTNPTGNVLTDNEIAQLRSLCREAGVPLIIDGAYGVPFPGAIFTEARPVWDEDMILTLSLSKLGLPGTRTAVVVARPEVAEMIASMSANVGLANGNIGQEIVTPMLQDRSLLRHCAESVRPFYMEKSRQAQAWVRELFADHFPWRMHVSEGALFLWLWFPELPITTAELYVRLKEQGVLIIPGEHFFFGLPGDWEHSRQCLRMTFTMDGETVRSGIETIARVIEELG